jgi:pyridoxal phosphate enzyme (YggS family)
MRVKPSSQSIFAQKLQDLQKELSTSKLLIVSKTRSIDEIQVYYQLGHRDFGENRVQELGEKAEALKASCPEIRWHMIGNLQSNKINQLFATPNLWAIHSVDSEDLLDKLIKAREKLNQDVRLFLQFNTSKEMEKSGFEDYDTLLVAAKKIPAQSHLKLFGVMTMGTLRTENFKEEARRCFQELNEIAKTLSKDTSLPIQTSMGMSQDYQIALGEKSNWIRLGTTMFA